MGKCFKKLHLRLRGVFCLVLSVLLLFGAMQFVYADPVGTVSISVPETAEQGRDATATVKIDNLKGIAGMQFVLVYDKAVFSVSSSALTKGALVKDSFFASNVSKAGEIRVAFLWDEEYAGNGSVTLCSIKLSVKSNARVGNTTLQIKDIVATDAGDDPSKLDVNSKAGGITIKAKPAKAPTTTPGGKGGGSAIAGPTGYIDNEYIAKEQIDVGTKAAGEIRLDTGAIAFDGTTARVAINDWSLQNAITASASRGAELEASFRSSGLPVEGRKTVNIKMPVWEATNSIFVGIPISAFESAFSRNVTHISVETNYATVALAPDALANHFNSYSQNAEITLSKVPLGEMAEGISEGIGSSQVIGFDIMVDGNAVDEYLGNIPAEVSINYNMSAAKNIDNIIAYSIKDDGSLIPIKNSVFDAQNGKVTFTTNVGGNFIVLEGEQPSFTDIADASWAQQYINAMAVRGIILGTGDGTCEPNRTVTREEFTKMLVEAFGFDHVYAETDFADVPQDAWYYKYIAIGENVGLLQGIGDNLFGVGTDITRQDMATMAFRAANIADKRIKRVQYAFGFTDNASISDYAKESITYLQQANIISGMGDNVFAPTESSTRAQAIKIIYMLQNAR